MALAAELQVDPRVAYCECGCGEPTNQRQLDAWRLRGEGMKNVDIAEMWGVDPATVKRHLHGKPSRFIRGHFAYAQMTQPGHEWRCQRCGEPGRTTQNPPPKFCQRRACMAANGPRIWGAIAITVGRRHAAQQTRLQQFFAQRRDRHERRVRRAWRQSAEGRAAWALAKQRFDAGQTDALHAWLAAQTPEVRDFIAQAESEPRNWRDFHLDEPLRSGKGTFHNLIVNGYRHDRVEWSDPTGNDAADRLDFRGRVEWDHPWFEAFVRAAPIIPAYHLLRCITGDLALFVTDDGPMFCHTPRRQQRAVVDVDPRVGFGWWDKAASSAGSDVDTPEKGTDGTLRSNGNPATASLPAPSQGSVHYASQLVCA